MSSSMTARMRTVLLPALLALLGCGGTVGENGAANGSDGGNGSGGNGNNGNGNGGNGGSGGSGGSGSGDGGGASDGGGNDGGGSASDGGATMAPTLAEGFEAAALDASRWAVVGAEGHQAPTATTAVIDATRAHGGQRSLHVHDGFIQTAPPAPAFYLRAFAWFDADPGSGHWMSWVAVGPGDRGTEVRYGGHYDILEANYFGNDDEVISDPKGYCSPTCTNGVAVPVRRWACVEAWFGPDELRFWLDGTEVTPLHVTRWRNQAAPWSPAYDRVRLGFHDFQGAPVDVWYDDVALSSARIGCD
jgi:polysaccharide lyase-like protein